MYAQPQPSDQELAELYGHDYYDAWGIDKKPLARMKGRSFLRILDRIGRQNINSMLDIGCGLGQHLDIGQELGWDVVGVDVNPRAVELNSGRHKTVHSSIEQLDLEQKFDLIILLEVLEHLRDPRACLEKILQFMHDDSILVLTTIDAGSLRARTMGSSWYHIHREHLHYFHRASLTHIAERAGHEVIRLEAATKHFSVDYILGNLEAKAPGRFLPLVAGFLMKILPQFVARLVLPPLPEGLLLVTRKANLRDSL